MYLENPGNGHHETEFSRYKILKHGLPLPSFVGAPGAAQLARGYTGWLFCKEAEYGLGENTSFLQQRFYKTIEKIVGGNVFGVQALHWM